MAVAKTIIKFVSKASVIEYRKLERLIEYVKGIYKVLLGFGLKHCKVSQIKISGGVYIGFLKLSVKTSIVDLLWQLNWKNKTVY